MSDDALAQQIEYYRRRAAEYDRTAYGPDVAAARRRIGRVIAALQPRGRALEIACGTGMWTQCLAGSVRNLVALDGAAETIAIAERRLRSGQVTFRVGNVFEWAPPPGVDFDTIFMAFWLSHVPRPDWASFLDRVGLWLAPGGRVIVVDECTPRGRASVAVTNGTTTELRLLESGAVYRIVKEALTPELLTREFTRAGWVAEVALDRDDWILATLSR